MTERYAKITISILLSLGVIVFFVSKVWSYGLFVLGFSGLMYAGYKYVNKKQRPLAVSGSLILLLLALYKFFNALSQ